MRPSTRRTSRRPAVRSAFTLVEMLVSVALVLMLMSMFAAIFQIATESMAKQRGISLNDQRARSLYTVIRKDLQHRTFRYPFAFYPGEDSATSPTSFSNRGGYIYISTNGSDSGLDDLIQFTVNANILTEDTDGTPYFGRATELVDRNTAGASTTGLAVSPNQPEADDGSLAPNAVASSPMAEVCYFIRRGNLYRRVLLIREPLSVAGQNLGPQPTAQSGYNYFSGQPDPTDVTTYDGMIKVNNGSFVPDAAAPFGTLTNDFYLLFDHSALATDDGLGNISASFHGVASLSNEAAGAGAVFLANPIRRFGFNPVTGRSREHTVHPAAALGPSVFLGRFTQAETSTLNFNWPQGLSTDKPLNPTDYTVPDLGTLTGTNGNPMDVEGTPLAMNAGNGVVSAFDGSVAAGVEGRGGERRVEDLLLANVHEMKIELWDQRLQRFVAPGHLSSNPTNGQIGDYHVNRCLNREYRVMPGPAGVPYIGTIFDTWHPDISRDFDGIGGVTPDETNPSYIAYSFYPPLPAAGGPPLPFPISMPAPNVEDSRNRGYWTASTDYFLGDVVFVQWTDLLPFDGVFQYSEMPEPKFQIAYRCIVAGTSNGAPPANWSRKPGQRISEAAPSTVVWESFDNRRPLQSIRLQFRFHDKTSDGMRQLSLVVPLTEAVK